MPYCSVCGKEVLDTAVVCPGCGCMVNGNTKKNIVSANNANVKTQTSFVLGIIGIVSAFIFALAGHICSIIGIVFGIKEYKESNIMTGLILSIIGEVASVISSIIGIAIVTGLY